MIRLLLLLTSMLVTACSSYSLVGERCTESGDCEPGQSCFPLVDGGFCSKGCAQLGDTRECTTGSICTFMGGSSQVCSPVCKDGVVCPEGTTCKAVSGTSDQQSCQP